MSELAGINLQRLVADELFDLPRHFYAGSDYVEFGSNYIDMCHAAALLSPLIWIPAPLRSFVGRSGRITGWREVDRCVIRDVRRGILPDGRVFCKFVLAAPGRTGSQMREMLLSYAGDQQLVFDRRDPAFNGNVVRLIAHYLDAKDAARKNMADHTHIDAAGQETIHIRVAEPAAQGGS